MKKALLFAVVVGVVSLTACKKDRTCTCTTTYTDSNGTDISTSTTTYLKSKKHDARIFCVSTSNTYDDGSTREVDCTLK